MIITIEIMDKPRVALHLFACECLTCPPASMWFDIGGDYKTLGAHQRVASFQVQLRIAFLRGSHLHLKCIFFSASALVVENSSND